jgi:hypothetical protein
MNQDYKASAGDHPITPPPELLDQWCMENNWRDIAIQAAQWGSDQELEACCEWVAMETLESGELLRTARRPKPPSLKEQALERLELAKKYVDVEPIRLALEALDD